MNEGTPGLSEAKGRTSVCPAKGRCSPGRARHPLRDGVAVGTPQCGLGAEQGAGTRARWKPGSKVPAGCTAGRTGPASHCIPLSLARPEGAPTATPPCSSLGSRPPLVPLPPPPGAASVQRTIAGAVGLPGRKREGRGCAPDQARGGCWRHGCGVWGPVGDLGRLRGFGVAVGLREAAGTQPTPSLGWALRAQLVWGWWEHSGTGSLWCCQALAVAPGLTITAGPTVLPDNAKEPCWAGGSWDGAHGTGQAPHPLT